MINDNTPYKVAEIIRDTWPQIYRKPDMNQSYSNYIHTKKLNLNLSKIKNSSHKMYNYIKKTFESGSDYNGQSSMEKQIFAKYNLLMYPLPEFYELYCEIRNFFRENLNSEDLNEPHYIQCWLNFYKKGEFISWHEHWPPEVNGWHGYYCVDVEPSKTTYKLPGYKKNIDVENCNNLLVLSKSNGDKHRTWPWEYDSPRITIAFDIVPSWHIQNDDSPNHWVPI
jgi:hypothetical protein